MTMNMTVNAIFHSDYEEETYTQKKPKKAKNNDQKAAQNVNKPVTTAKTSQQTKAKPQEKPQQKVEQTKKPTTDTTTSGILINTNIPAGISQIQENSVDKLKLYNSTYKPVNYDM